VLDRFLGFSSRDLQRAVSIAAPSTPEPLTDVRGNGLNGLSELPDVQ